MLLGLLGGILSRHLGRVGRRLARALETHGTGGRPGDGVSLGVGDGDHRIVEGRVHMRDSGGNILALAPANAGGFFAHSRSSRGRGAAAAGPTLSVTWNAALLLLAGNRLRRPLAGAGVGMGALAAHRQSAAMPQPAVAPQVHQPLDVHRDFAPQVTLHDVVAVDDLADLQHFLVGQLGHSALVRDPDFRHDFVGLFSPDAMDILQCNNDTLVGGYVDAGDASHGHSLLLPARKTPGGRSSRSRFANDNATPSPFPGARYRSNSRFGCGLLMDSPAFRQPLLAIPFA